MNCPQCGDVCRCLPEPHPTASSRWLPDAAKHDAPTTSPASLRTAVEASPHFDSELKVEEASPGSEDERPESEAPTGDGPTWRDELSARLNLYRARRKPRPPRYPSLRLRFDPPLRAAGFASPPEFETASDQALAFERLSEVRSVPANDDALHLHPAPQAAMPVPSQSFTQPTVAVITTKAVAPNVITAKIIEFPRFAPPPTPPADELAETVIDRPRILEAPDVAPPPPALGGITIETTRQSEVEKRPGIDIPLQGAPLARRIVAAAVDGVIVALASALFGFVFGKVAAVRPPQGQILELTAGLPCLLWVAYQYLLLVYCASTPGLRLAGLELARFDGTTTSRRLRRWRVLASYLSAISLGLGYAWVFLDEDALCWHDRITHTFLAPKCREAVHVNNSSALG
jgi:uncharacterized RDD family membrane protein YckC